MTSDVSPAQVVLFDLDHTLLDSDTSLEAAYRSAAGAGGLADPDGARDDFDRINHALWRAVERGELHPDQVKLRRFAELLRHVGDDADVERRAQLMAEAFVEGLIVHGELYPGALDLLQALAERPLGLVTNGIGRVQRGRLDRLGLADTFDVVVISGELQVAKPDPAIFDVALDALGAPPRDTVAMVGDNWGSDIVGAAAAGVRPIWFNPSGTPPPPEPSGVAQVADLGAVAKLLV